MRNKTSINKNQIKNKMNIIKDLTKLIHFIKVKFFADLYTIIILFDL